MQPLASCPLRFLITLAGLLVLLEVEYSASTMTTETAYNSRFYFFEGDYVKYCSATSTCAEKNATLVWWDNQAEFEWICDKASGYSLIYFWTLINNSLTHWSDGRAVAYMPSYTSWSSNDCARVDPDYKDMAYRTCTSSYEVVCRKQFQLMGSRREKMMKRTSINVRQYTGLTTINKTVSSPIDCSIYCLEDNACNRFQHDSSSHTCQLLPGDGATETATGWAIYNFTETLFDDTGYYDPGT